MKVILVNGSPHQHGCTFTALDEARKTLEEEGIGTEMFWVGTKPLAGCLGCHKCAKLKHCVFDDRVNEFLAIAGGFDGFLFGTPVHWAAADGFLTSFMGRAFYVDQLQLKDSPAMTATEVQVRYELMQRLLGPTLGRLMSDFLDPLLSRTFNIMYRNGALPERPEVLNNESDLDIQYVGPLARAQKSDVAASTERWLGMVAQMAEIKPEVLEFPDWELIVRDHANVLNVPAKYMKSASKIAADRKKQQQAQSQMMALEQAKMAGEAGESLGKAAQSLKG